MKITDTFLKQTITENLWALYKTVAQLTDSPFLQEQEYSYIQALPSPWPNFVFNLPNSYQEQKKVIDQLISLIEERIAPPFLIIDPMINEENLQKLLNESGLKLVMRWPAMIIEYQQLAYSENKICTIERVNNSSDLEEWFAIAQKTLFNGKLFQKDFYKIVNNKNLHFYFAKLDGQKVGTTLVNVTPQCAGFYMVSILEEYRGRGIAKSMIGEIMSIEHNSQMNWFVLQANSQSERLYLDLGFKHTGYFDIYWKIGLF